MLKLFGLRSLGVSIVAVCCCAIAFAGFGQVGVNSTSDGTTISAAPQITSTSIISATTPAEDSFAVPNLAAVGAKETAPAVAAHTTAPPAVYALVSRNLEVVAMNGTFTIRT